MKINLGKRFGKDLGEVEVKGVDVAKKVVSSVAAYGAGVVLYSIIQKHLPEGMRFHTRMAVAVGTWALVNVGKDAVTAHTDETIDEIVKFIKKMTDASEGLEYEIDEQDIDAQSATSTA